MYSPGNEQKDNEKKIIKKRQDDLRLLYRRNSE